MKTTPTVQNRMLITVVIETFSETETLKYMLQRLNALLVVTSV